MEHKQTVEEFEKELKKKEEAKRKAFEKVAKKRKFDITQVLQKLIVKREIEASFNIDLEKSRLNIKIETPAFWSDVAKLDCWFSSPKFEISYGAGGHNKGFTSVDCARAKGEALLLLCDLVDELKTMDWTKFAGARHATIGAGITEQTSRVA